MAQTEFTFDEWLNWAFDHPVAEFSNGEWWRNVPDRDEGGLWLDGPAEIVLPYVITLFEDPLQYLSSYSDAQMDQGLNFLVSTACSDHFVWLVDENVNIELRLTTISSIETLYPKLFVPKISENLRTYTKPLDYMCYMLWDYVVREADRVTLDSSTAEGYRTERDTAIDRAFRETLSRILSLENIGCQQSALHGLGHLVSDAGLGRDVIEQYLSDHPDLLPDLREYARQALQGIIL